MSLFMVSSAFTPLVSNILPLYECRYTWELSVHLRFAVAVGFKDFAQGHFNTESCFYNLRPPLVY